MAHPTVQAAIDDAFARILACGKAPGIIWGDERLAQHALDIGGLFVAVGQDLVTIARQADALAAKYKR
jgi:4-hydroxy-2-oxoheptanedioate aldolase